MAAFIWLSVFFWLAVGCLVAGSFVLFGAGWALITASVPFAAVSVVIARGIHRGAR